MYNGSKPRILEHGCQPCKHYSCADDDSLFCPACADWPIGPTREDDKVSLGLVISAARSISRQPAVRSDLRLWLVLGRRCLHGPRWWLQGQEPGQQLRWWPPGRRQRCYLLCPALLNLNGVHIHDARAANMMQRQSTVCCCGSTCHPYISHTFISRGEVLLKLLCVCCVRNRAVAARATTTVHVRRGSHAGECVCGVASACVRLNSTPAQQEGRGWTWVQGNQPGCRLDQVLCEA